MSGSQSNLKYNLRTFSCISSVLLLLMLIASLCVYFAGYVNLGKTNERLILTNCTMLENISTDKTCYQRCSYNKKRLCPYPCYDWKQIAHYVSDEGSLNNFTYRSGYNERYYSRIDNIFDEKPVGFDWNCYYDPKHKKDVVDSLYNMKAWKIASIIMFCLTIVNLKITLILVMWSYYVDSDDQEVAEKGTNRKFDSVIELKNKSNLYRSDLYNSKSSNRVNRSYNSKN